jgi:hypothetical protein
MRRYAEEKELRNKCSSAGDQINPAVDIFSTLTLSASLNGPVGGFRSPFDMYSMTSNLSNHMHTSLATQG